ncbi:MAG: hypothetical protein JNN05_05610, partial [Candidatus Omnitrophica bacterium]|nr:hypothetical protein [Candidatus Omnitrophota bacterium]
MPLSFAQSCSVTTMEKGKEIRACQIEDMRKLINQARAACALGAIPSYTFTDEPLIPNKTQISIRHMDEIKEAIKGISTNCGPTRPEASFKDVRKGDIIATGDFVTTFNDFVSTSFCGDSICQAGFEDLTSCGVDCGGAAQFYCNGIGGCYA